MNKIRKGDEVIVLAGRDKGKRGKITLRKDDSHVMVEGPIESGLCLQTGAGNETRTRDPDLGKVVLYQLSYSRAAVAHSNT